MDEDRPRQYDIAIGLAVAWARFHEGPHFFTEKYSGGHVSLQRGWTHLSMVYRGPFRISCSS
jgi:hypothetical protein